MAQETKKMSGLKQLPVALFCVDRFGKINE